MPDKTDSYLDQCLMIPAVLLRKPFDGLQVRFRRKYWVTAIRNKASQVLFFGSSVPQCNDSQRPMERIADSHGLAVIYRDCLWVPVKLVRYAHEDESVLVPDMEKIMSSTAAEEANVT